MSQTLTFVQGIVAVVYIAKCWHGKDSHKPLKYSSQNFLLFIYGMSSYSGYYDNLNVVGKSYKLRNLVLNFIKG